MKTCFKHIAIIGFVFTIASCTGSGEGKGSTDLEKQEMNDQRTTRMLETSVKLNDGRPWEANTETVFGIHNMKKTIEEYNGKKNSPEMYKELSLRLMEQFEYIFRECTMKGVAHDQLHNYLLPMKVYFEELNSTDMNIAENGLKRFQQHLALFPKYFKG